MSGRRSLGSGIVGVLTLATAASSGCRPDFESHEWEVIQALGTIPSEISNPTNKYGDNDAAAELGQRIFFEKGYVTAVQADGPSGSVGEIPAVSCATCHDPNSWFSDSRTEYPVSHGVDWTPRNSPSLVNAAFYRHFSHDGRHDSMWMQGANVPESGVDFGSTRLAFVHLIYEKYRDDYNAIFPQPLPDALDPEAPDADRFPASGRPKYSDGEDGSWEGMTAEDQHTVNLVMANVGKSLEAYQYRLVSRNAPFERFVSGEEGAISDEAKRGLRLFIGKAGCVACHNGSTFTDQDFHNTGVEQKTHELVPDVDEGLFASYATLMENTFNGAGEYSDDREAGAEKLEALGENNEENRGKFRTKSLPQIAETGPYFHNGSAATLMDVVEHYNRGGAPGGTFSGVKDSRIAPLDLTEDEKQDLVEFMTTLTGEPVPEDLREDTSAP